MNDMIALRGFLGEEPLKPPHLLPELGARQAEFCDFAHGHLMPLKQGFLLQTMVEAVKTIYTEDGINFFTWPVETSVEKSPVQQDPYSRVYFIDAGVLKVTTTAGMGAFGGQPGSSWKAGVPKPTVAPALTLVDLTEYPDYPGATVSITTWWEYDSQRYQETTVTPTVVNALRVYTFDAPARDTANTPAGAVVRATFKASDATSKPFLTVNLTAGDVDTRSSALPGGISLSMVSTAGVTHKIELTYGIVETRAYAYTNVNTWLEESGPGPAAQVATTYLQSVTVDLTASDFAGYRPFSAYRTYRTMGSSAAYLKIHDGTELSFSDTSHKAADVLGSLETLDYSAPPPLLDVIVRMPGGSLAGFHGNTLYISEPYRPHTWQYQVGFAKNIRGIMPAPQSLVVTTAAGCHVVVGAHPSAMQPIDLPAPQAGVSQRSMADLEGVTCFASHDGIVAVNGTQAGLMTSSNLFARDDWRSRYGAVLDDASLHFAYHDGCLVATSSAQALGFVLRMDGADAGNYTRFNEQMDAMFRLPVADSLYYSKGADVYQFRGGSSYAYTWWSRDFIFNRPRNLGAGLIRCSGPVTLTVYMDGVQWWTGTVNSGYFRLPAGRTSQRWSVKLQGTAVVEEFYLARSMSELQNV